MADYYPPTGFHFSVAFEGFTKSEQDLRFQQVSGLSVQVQTEEIAEGGENRFKHRLPQGLAYEDLELKRGMVNDSELIFWCREAIEQFEFQPRNILISLLDEAHVPVSSWQVVHAFPVHWSISEFDAMQNQVTIETLRLQYQYFRYVSPD